MAKKFENYWENYYEADKAPEEPSQFANYVAGEHIQKGASLVELGCGNGRDARYFAAQGISVLAVDQCAQELQELSAKNGDNPQYHAGDFTTLADQSNPVDTIYSRFTMHSIDADGQARVLDWAYRNLKEDGILCIETRGQKNEIYQKGEPVEGEPDAYIFEDHYRRFVDFDLFKKDIESVGFKLIDAAEETGFAPFEDTDYHYIRVVAQK